MSWLSFFFTWSTTLLTSYDPPEIPCSLVVEKRHDDWGFAGGEEAPTGRSSRVPVRRVPERWWLRIERWEWPGGGASVHVSEWVRVSKEEWDEVEKGGTFVRWPQVTWWP